MGLNSSQSLSTPAFPFSGAPENVWFMNMSNLYAHIWSLIGIAIRVNERYVLHFCVAIRKSLETNG